MKMLRLWTVLGLLTMAAVIVQARGDVDREPVSVPLDQFPQTIGPWQGTEVPLDAEVLDVLGKGFFLNRVFTASAGADLPGSSPGVLQLFIGYFPTQRTGQAIHSPQNCLPGAGWIFETSGVTNLKGPSGQALQVGEYIISNGSAREEVLYWYRSHGRTMASDYVAKLYTLLDSIRYDRTDAALVRVVVPITQDGPQVAHERAIHFAEQLSPILPAYIPD
jgi:EpsI family protein